MDEAECCAIAANEVVASPSSVESPTTISLPGGVVMLASDESDGQAKREVDVGPLVVMRHEVTRAMWESVMGEQPLELSLERPSPELAQEFVSWYDALRFANQLSRAHGLTPSYELSGAVVRWNLCADGWRLPTSAEWEYAYGAAAGGLLAAPHEKRPTAPVCAQRPPLDQLCDMDNRIAEWVWDSGAPPDEWDPYENRIVRGMVHFEGQDPQTEVGEIRSHTRIRGLGFRLVRNPGSTGED